MSVFGVNPQDGTIAPCRAKPENRGRGRCFHGDHIELDGIESSPESVQRFNEEKLAAHFGGNFFTFTASGSPKTVESDHGSLTHNEFHEASEDISQAFTQESWQLFQNFYSEFSTIVDKETELGSYQNEIISKVRSYLDADTPIAARLRAFLGPEVDTDTFAVILVSEVRSMTAAIPIRNSKRSDSVSRVISTSCANDMSRKRYVASVLFFAGRCCYCNVVLTKKEGAYSQATGEHITPVNPADPNATVGVTRYGNMALACHRCNSDRGNKDLSSWISETDVVPEEQKTKALRRIEAFRGFALYEEYSPEKSQMIRATTELFKARRDALPRNSSKDKNLRYDPAAHREYVNELKATLFDLRSFLSS